MRSGALLLPEILAVVLTMVPIAGLADSSCACPDPPGGGGQCDGEDVAFCTVTPEETCSTRCVTAPQGSRDGIRLLDWMFSEALGEDKSATLLWRDTFGRRRVTDFLRSSTEGVHFQLLGFGGPVSIGVPQWARPELEELSGSSATSLEVAFEEAWKDGMINVL